MFKNILVVYSQKSSKVHEETLEKIREILEKALVNFSFVSIKDFNKGDLNEIDLVISLGGDGNFIRLSHFLKEIPILGINSDSNSSEGGLCTLNELDLENLTNIIDGQYKIINRERIDIFLNEDKIPEIALNEVYIGTSNQFHTSRYIVNFREVEEEHRSSGVLVSTGTGSKVWFKSAGGEPFSHDEKKLKLLVREPFFSRLFQPKVLVEEISYEEKISFDSKRCIGGIIAIDSNVTYDFNEGTKVELKISDFPLKVVEIA